MMDSCYCRCTSKAKFHQKLCILRPQYSVALLLFSISFISLILQSHLVWLLVRVEMQMLCTTFILISYPSHACACPILFMVFACSFTKQLLFCWMKTNKWHILKNAWTIKCGKLKCSKSTEMAFAKRAVHIICTFHSFIARPTRKRWYIADFYSLIHFVKFVLDCSCLYGQIKQLFSLYHLRHHRIQLTFFFDGQFSCKNASLLAIFTPVHLETMVNASHSVSFYFHFEVDYKVWLQKNRTVFGSFTKCSSKRIHCGRHLKWNIKRQRSHQRVLMK